MASEIRWTEESEEHIARHGVEPAEVEEAAYERPRLEATGRAGVRLVFGTTSAGRYLLVVLGDHADGSDYCVTARDMTDKERKTFRRKAR